MEDELLNKMFDDYFKHFLSLIGYKNLDFQSVRFDKIINENKNILFSDKEKLLKAEIYRKDYSQVQSFNKSIRCFLRIACGYFKFNVTNDYMSLEFQKSNNLYLTDYMKPENFCLGQWLYDSLEPYIISAKPLYMNNIIKYVDIVSE